MTDNLTEITDQNFEEAVLQSTQPVLVDFWAPWCGPCKAIGPMVAAVADAYADRLTVGKCNVDDNPDIPKRFGIRSVPTVMVFKDGQVFEQTTGMIPRGQLERIVQNVLEGGGPTSPFVVQ